MRKRHLILAVLVVALVAVAAWAAVAGAGGAAPQLSTRLAADPPAAGFAAYEYMADLSDGIGRRVVGTPNNAAAASYISDAFTTMGYTPQEQQFKVRTFADKVVTSQNIIAVKPGTSAQRIVIGAHYDSMPVGRGAFDNGTGDGLLLQLANDLQSQTTPCTLVFVAFSGEEEGMVGSTYYVKHLTAQDKADTVLMINFDSVAGGDQLCVYSAGSAQWPRLELQRIARSQGSNIQTNPGLNKHYPYGTTGDWSDHAPFRKAGIPYLYFEATNWLIGALDGYTNNPKYGEIWHTPKDTVAWIETVFPGRMLSQLSESVQALEVFLTTPLQTPKATGAAAVRAALPVPAGVR